MMSDPNTPQQARHKSNTKGQSHEARASTDNSETLLTYIEEYSKYNLQYGNKESAEDVDTQTILSDLQDGTVAAVTWLFRLYHQLPASTESAFEKLDALYHLIPPAKKKSADIRRKYRIYVKDGTYYVAFKMDQEDSQAVVADKKICVQRYPYWQGGKTKTGDNAVVKTYEDLKNKRYARVDDLTNDMPYAIQRWWRQENPNVRQSEQKVPSTENNNQTMLRSPDLNVSRIPQPSSSLNGTVLLPSPSQASAVVPSPNATARAVSQRVSPAETEKDFKTVLTSFFANRTRPCIQIKKDTLLILQTRMYHFSKNDTLISIKHQQKYVKVAGLRKCFLTGRSYLIGKMFYMREDAVKAGSIPMSGACIKDWPVYETEEDWASRNIFSVKRLEFFATIEETHVRPLITSNVSCTFEEVPHHIESNCDGDLCEVTSPFIVPRNLPPLQMQGQSERPPASSSSASVSGASVRPPREDVPVSMNFEAIATEAPQSNTWLTLSYPVSFACIMAPTNVIFLQANVDKIRHLRVGDKIYLSFDFRGTQDNKVRKSKR